MRTLASPTFEIRFPIAQHVLGYDQAFCVDSGHYRVTDFWLSMGASDFVSAMRAKDTADSRLPSAGHAVESEHARLKADVFARTAERGLAPGDEAARGTLA